MKHDPFYQQIIDGLSRALDPEVFERCAVGLLRPEWPTLVPIRGGGDAGMDGAIADGKAEPFPLISTTTPDVIGNLTRSLDSYLADGGTQRRAILSTSQPLSQPRRKNLETRAREKGFLLIQIYDQAAIADRLYRDAGWCRELLGLTDEPSALSMIPLTRRPLLEIPVIGREQDLTWLRTTTGDKVITGVPGCGKTFLLRIYAEEEQGLFVVRDDRAAIAPALRTQQPRRVIVDDAHLRLDFLVSLRQLRHELGADFEIIACCWPGGRNQVVEASQVSRQSVRELGLLARDEIVKIVEAVGIRGPRPLIREIVDQAEGRPGLAVTLALLCLQGGLDEVALGHALSRNIGTTFERLIGKQSTVLLAALSLGGDSGMSLQVVAHHLELPLAEAQRAVTELAAGGVISEVPLHNCLAVRPAGLRHALVRDHFFGGPASLPLDSFLGQVPNARDASSTLIGARARGGKVPSSLLETLLEQFGTTQLWGEYASLGQEETIHVVTHHPELTHSVAPIALHYAPERAIPLLLQAAAGDRRALAPHAESPLRRIEVWIHEAVPGTGEAVARRRMLVRCIRGWIESAGLPEIASSALRYAISPGFGSLSSDPGSGTTLTITQGILTVGEIEPFIARVVDLKADGWDELLGTCLASRSLQPHAVTILLGLPDPPEHLLEAALRLLPGLNEVEFLCRWGRVAAAALPRLLAHDVARIASAAAIGLWLHHEENGIPVELKALWRQAILRADGNELFLAKVLARDADLSAEWLQRYLKSSELPPWRLPESTTAAIDTLSEAERAELLAHVPDSLESVGVIRALVRDSLWVYEQLLLTKHLQQHHLAPLGDTDRPHWSTMIVMALDAGHPAEEVAGAALHELFRSWSGPESEMWRQVMGPFDGLLTQQDNRVREVARIVRQRAEQFRCTALERERRSAVYGEF